MQPTGGQPGLNHGAVDAPSAEEVRGHVARVLASTAFKSSKRCHRFLDFIVIELLEGRASTIKERTLATQVFDRSPTWDAGGDDTIVRAEPERYGSAWLSTTTARKAHWKRFEWNCRWARM